MKHDSVIRLVHLPINGIDSEVSGIFSAMASMKTENARRTVTPRAIFSPESVVGQPVCSHHH